MDSDLWLQNFLSPVVLFFFFGLLAPLLRSPLEIPPTLSRFFSFYLLINIGLRGGVELHQTGFASSSLLSLSFALLLATLIPIYTFYIVRKRLPLADAAAVSAAYGSVSLVTFIAASSFLDRIGIPAGGHLVAAMALMESPAIAISLILYNIYRPHRGSIRLKSILHEALLNPSIYLLLTGLIIGSFTGTDGWRGLKPFSEDIFKGFLAFFLLDVGLLVGRHLKEGGHSPLVFLLALLLPLLNAAVSLTLGFLIGLPKEDLFLLTCLASSASYIAVPAAFRLILPEARPAIYVTMALGLTFPFNLLIGLPLYWKAVHLF
jgi:hypothetical protein